MFYVSYSVQLISQSDSKKIELESSLIDVQKEIMLGNTDHAIELLEEMQHEPLIRSISLFELAKLYKLKQQHDKAITAIHECNQTGPPNKWYLVYECNLLEEYGRYEASAMNYEKLIKLEPLNYTFYDQAALNYVKGNQIKKSLKILSQAETKFGKTPVIALRQANILSNSGDDKKAIQALEFALKSYPTHKDIIQLLLGLYDKQNLSEKAKDLRTKLNLKNSNPSEITDNIPASGKSRILRDKNLSLDDRIKFFLEQLQQNKFSEADLKNNLSDAENLVNEFPTDNKARTLLADLKFLNQNYAEASMDYEKAITLGKVPSSVYENLIFCYDVLNKWISLEKIVGAALESYPNFAQFYYYLSKSQYETNQFEQAKANINQALIMLRVPGKSKTKALLLKKKIWLKLNKGDELENINLQLKEGNKDDETMIENAILDCAISKKLDPTILEKMNTSKELIESRKHYLLAQYYYCNNQLEKATMQIDSLLLNENNQNPDGLALAAEIKLASHKPEEAKQLLEKALQKAEFKDNIRLIMK